MKVKIISAGYLEELQEKVNSEIESLERHDFSILDIKLTDSAELFVMVITYKSNY